MKNLLKRIISLSIAITVIGNILCLRSTAVFAQSRTQKYNTNYTLGNNPVENLIAVAEAQAGMTKSDLGYTEAWCADFVSDCAILAGLDDIIPGDPYCGTLYNNIIDADGTEVATPQRGDIVFYYCTASSCPNSGKPWVHVGIMLDSTNTIEGNRGGCVSYGGGSYTDCNGHTVASGVVTRKYVRPAYNSGPICGYDSPQENATITGSSFRFAGWIQAEKQITDITCSINDGQAYVKALLYTRPDVPNATAFLIEEVSTRYFHGGTNYVSVCVGYSDGTAETVARRSIVFPSTICGYDTPTDNEIIDNSTFRFQGWVEAPKDISSITCSINDGQAYVNALLYTRPDVPNATAFLIEKVDSELLHFGDNYVSVCVNYTDGTAETVAKRTVNKRYTAAVDTPLGGQFITEDTFPFRGWVLSNKSIKSIKCNLNNGSKYYTASMYKREDVPDADAYSVKIPKSELNNYENALSIYVEYNDGTTMNLNKTIVYKAELADMGSGFDGNIYAVGSKKLLTADSSDNIVINSDNSSNNQLWTFNRNNDGTYTIVSKANNKVIDNYSGTGTTESNVQVYESNGSNAQKWQILKSTGDYFYFVPVCSSTCCLDVYGNYIDDGTNVRLHTYIGSTNTAQQFKILRKDIADINSDGNVDKTDSALLLKYISGTNVEINEYVADVNEDDNIDVLDAIAILNR